AAPEVARANGGAVRRLPAGADARTGAGRPLHVFPGRIALRIPRGTLPARHDPERTPGPADVGRGARTLPRRRAVRGGRFAPAGTGADRALALRGVFPDGLGHRAVRA